MGEKKISANQLKLRQERYALLARYAPYIGTVVIVLAFALPLWVIGGWVRDLAGKTTNVNVVVSVALTITIALSLTLTGSFFVQRSKLAKQAAELERLRGRVSAYESRDLAAQGVGKKRR